jgi:hypothetical protein
MDALFFMRQREREMAPWRCSLFGPGFYGLLRVCLLLVTGDDTVTVKVRGNGCKFLSN